MTLKHKFRRLVQKRLGLDIIRYPGHDLLARTVQMLQYHEVNVVVDVGANDGAFAASIREVGYAGRIISFEPVSTPFSALSKRAAHDSKWDVYRCVIGANKGRATINIAGNAALSSSVLPMLDAHIAAGPDTRYIGTETVDQDCLDSILPRIGVSADDRTFVKLDVQGYEAEVLDGASDLLAGSGIIGLQLELSLTPLYEGAMTYREGLERTDALGMCLMGLGPVFTDPVSGRLLQADAIFFRAKSSYPAGQ
ncbi:FkbM family methyltransferase [Mycolicibacterium aromaticivorans]|uniref:FkbM family methyltransferase n=1 Tax=Mycolicibacterium aromaticivorans TaxID=318425 RepID=UPI001ED9C43D|nr:FkbM family methyltransferase [Mycolicibacterium aromaticivorans]